MTGTASAQLTALLRFEQERRAVAYRRWATVRFFNSSFTISFYVLVCVFAPVGVHLWSTNDFGMWCNVVLASAVIAAGIAWCIASHIAKRERSYHEEMGLSNDVNVLRNAIRHEIWLIVRWIFFITPFWLGFNGVQLFLVGTYVLFTGNREAPPWLYPQL